MTILDLYHERCRTPHNIDQHLPILREYAGRCQRVTELGTETGFSTTAFLAAQPEALDCYDIVRTDDVTRLEQLAGRTRFTFHQESSLDARLEATDLLFIDTLHTYEQVLQELWLHARHAWRYLIFHDIVACPVIVPAIYDYLQHHRCWKLEHWLTNQSGLAIYRREGG